MTPVGFGNIGLVLSAIAATFGFIGYVTLARFWRSHGGWHVFWYMALIAWILDLSVCRLWFGDSHWFAWVRAVSFTIGMPVVLLWRALIIFDLQLGGRRRTYPGDRQEETAP